MSNGNENYLKDVKAAKIYFPECQCHLAIGTQKGSKSDY